MSSARKHGVAAVLLVACTACSGSARAVEAPGPPTVRPAAGGAPKAQPVSITPQAPNVQPVSTTPQVTPAADAWHRVIVDLADRLSPVSISARDGVVSIVATAYQTHRVPTLFVSNATKWDEHRLDRNVKLLHSSWDAAGVPWLLLDAEDGVSAKRGHVGALELLASGRSEHYAHEMTTAPDGVPHACFSAEKDAKEFIYAVRSNTAKKAKSAWAIERIPLAIAGCSIAATNDDVHILVDGAFGVRVLSKKRGGSWSSELLTSNPYASSAIVRGPSGSVVFGYIQGHDLHLTRLKAAGVERSRVALGVDRGDVGGLALAIDQRERVHIAFRLTNKSIAGDIFYQVESEAPTLVARDRPERISLTVDEKDVPHIAYVVMWPDSRERQLVHARPRTASDAAAPGAYFTDEDTLLKNCATVIAERLGEARELERSQRAHRSCGRHAKPELPSLDALGAKCEAGDVNACLVAGTGSGKLEGLVSMDIALCPEERKGETCFSERSARQVIASWLNAGDDKAIALKYFERACVLGSRAACGLVAVNLKDEEHANDLLALACTPALPVACSALVVKLRKTPAAARKQLAQVRTTLATSCSTTEKPDACNALAYLEEAGLGGKAHRTDALRHHLRACELGSARSCIRLLTGPFSRPRPPRQLDAERFHELLLETCTDERDEDACLALATALGTGWGVPRDREAARSVLEEACENEQPLACKRLRARQPSK